MRKSVWALIVGLALAAFTVGIVSAANQPYGVLKGQNGTWGVVSCYDASNNPMACVEHWVFGAGSQDPAAGYGTNGDLFWRTDTQAFRVKSGGVWGAASGAIGGGFPLTDVSGTTSVTLTGNAAGQLGQLQVFNSGTGANSYVTISPSQVGINQYDGTNGTALIALTAGGYISHSYSPSGGSGFVNRGGGNGEALVSGVADTLFTTDISSGADYGTGGTVYYHVYVANSTNRQTESGQFTFTQNLTPGGTGTCDIDKGTFSQAVSSGTLTVAFACNHSGSGLFTIQATSTTDLASVTTHHIKWQANTLEVYALPVN